MFFVRECRPLQRTTRMGCCWGRSAVVKVNLKMDRRWIPLSSERLWRTRAGSTKG